MSSKRLGVLKTQDMNNKIKILDQPPFDKNPKRTTSLEKLKELLSSNQTYTEVLKRIEDLSKQALDAFNKKHDSIRLFDSGIIELGNINNDIVNTFLEAFDLPKDPAVERLVYNAIYNNQPENKKYVVNITRQNKINIEKAYRIAKTEKRGMKDSQKKIYDNLEKYVKLYQKAKALHDKIESSPLGTGPTIYADNDRKKIIKLTEQFNNLCGDIIEIRGKVEKLLEESVNKKEDCKEAVKCITYPELTKEETEAEVDRLNNRQREFQGCMFKGNTYQIAIFEAEVGDARNFKDFIKSDPLHVIKKYDGKFMIFEPSKGGYKSVEEYCAEVCTGTYIFKKHTLYGPSYHVNEFMEKTGKYNSLDDFIINNSDSVIKKYDGKFTIDGKSVKNYCEALKKKKK